jgi:hypothetical protein
MSVARRQGSLLARIKRLVVIRPRHPAALPPGVVRPAQAAVRLVEAAHSRADRLEQLLAAPQTPQAAHRPALLSSAGWAAVRLVEEQQGAPGHLEAPALR